MIIGNFSYNPDTDVYAGVIATLTLERHSVEFRPTEKGGDKEPDYRVVQDRSGGLIELGAAWKRSSDKGRDYLSVLLDDPALPSSFNAAMFLSDQDYQATLVWQRQAKKAPSPDSEPAAPEASKPANGRSRRPSVARRAELA
jgi:uncharacterized protein (DUF736 family)